MDCNLSRASTKSIPLCQLANATNASPQRFCTKYVDRLNINNCGIRVTVLDRHTHLVDKLWKTLIFIHCYLDNDYISFLFLTSHSLYNYSEESPLHAYSKNTDNFPGFCVLHLLSVWIL